MSQAGVWRYLKAKSDLLLISGVAVIYLFGYMLYSAEADYSLPSYETCMTEKPASSPVPAKFPELEAIREISDKLSASIDALPNLEKSGALPDLHTAVRRYKEAAQDDLFDTLQHLSQRRFNELFRADDSVRREVREILFTWAGVENMDPNSRGPFIDARELAFLERSRDDPFLQDGRYPNPAPIDAGRMRDAFDAALNVAYARLVAQAAEKDLFDTAASAQPDAPFSAAALDRLAKHGGDFTTLEQKSAYWTNVVRMAQPPAGVLSSFMKTANGVALDRLIRASVPTLSLEKVLERLSQSPAKKGGYYTDRTGRPIGFNVSYLPQKVRLVCYGLIENQPTETASSGPR
jgi:hypothetical protein